MSQEMNAKELEAKKKAQERATKPFHPRDVPLFVRDKGEVQESEAKDKPDANRK